jgi:hypothetical protein
VTGRSAEEWASDARDKKDADRETSDTEPQTCLQIVATLRVPGRGDTFEPPFAPWGVQLAGNFSKDRALASFRRASRTYASLIKDSRPMIIGTRLRYRGSRTFYRVRAPAETRQAAEQLCRDIRSAGGSCIVLPS